MGRSISKAKLAEAFEYLDGTPGAEVRDLLFRFGLTEDAARNVYTAWTKTLGLAEIDGRVDETFDSLTATS